MKYTIKDLKADFPDDDACLDYLFKQRFGEIHDFGKFYRVTGRKCYAHSETGDQIHPLANTIFHKSSTPLTTWFFAIFLFSQSRNGVSAKELQRALGVTYKCAYRMGQQIRKLMKEEPSMLGGVVEADEAYMGGHGKNRAYIPYKAGKGGKAIVLGMVERDGKVVTRVVADNDAYTLLGEIRDNVAKTAHLVTDTYTSYKRAKSLVASHTTINHSKGHYVMENIHTNTMEGYWGNLKRSIKGTYVHVSKRKLQTYLDEFSFRYSLRKSETHLFPILIGRV